MIFRSLTPDEVTTFRIWARKNYRAGDIINELWHPVVREECERINKDKE